MTSSNNTSEARVTAPCSDRQALRPVRRQSELDAALDFGEIPIIVGRGLFVLAGDAIAHARSGIIDVRDRACMFATDAAAVRASDWSLVWAKDQVRVDAYDHAVVLAAGGCSVRAADRSQVIADDLARTTVLDHATVWAGAAVTIAFDGPAVTIQSAGRPGRAVQGAAPLPS